MASAMPDSGTASTGPVTTKALLLALASGSAMQASIRFSPPMTTMTPVPMTMRTVLPRPAFPVQPPSPLRLEQ